MQYKVGIYLRLSRDDNNGSQESMSIGNQKTLLEKYVKEQEWEIYDLYIDDGISGTTSERADFQRMIKDIKSKKINCVITKDLSRLSRNYRESADHRDFFLENGVRYIAINDNFDSNNNTDDISTPIKEMLNEMYASDISKKVRSTFNTMAQQGKFKNSRAPYGYFKSPDDKHKLVIDENVSYNVIRVFELYLAGKTGRAIADIFNKEGLTPPNEYFYTSIGKPNPYRNNKNKWSSATMMNIIKNPVYYGAIANGKRAVKSYKNHTVVRKDFDEWIIVEDMHEPLISKELWLDAQKINKKNKDTGTRRSSDGEVSIFAGLIKCVDCGGNLTFSRKYYKSYTKEFFRCSTYVQKGKDVCPPHVVDYNVIYNAVLSDIQRYATLAIDDERTLITRISQANNDFKNKNMSRYEKSIRQSKNRIKEIDGHLQSLFEEKVSGGVSDSIFKRMAKKYEDEQTKLIEDLEQLEIELANCKKNEQDLTGWIRKIKECLSLDSLTRAIVIELIDHIEVSDSYEKEGEQHIDINITYKFNRFNVLQEKAS